MLALSARGCGRPVLWLHGYTMDSSLWAPVWELLPGWRHVGVDLPGHGRSPDLAAGATLSDVAGQVTEIARAVGARALVALSFGTAVALQVAIDSPEVLDALVLGAPTVGGAPAEPGTAERYRELVALRRDGADGAALAECWMQPPPDIFRGTMTRPGLRRELRAAIARHTWSELDTGAMRFVVGQQQSDEQLAGIPAATRLMVGEHDLPGVLATARRLTELMPDVVARPMPECGHLCVLERPALAAELIGEHLAAVCSGDLPAHQPRE